MITNRTFWPVFFISFGLAMIISEKAQAATARIIWCANWNYEFEDAGLGEEYLTSESWYAPAKYARSTLYTCGTGQNPGSCTKIESFVLDSNGCVQKYLTVGTWYKFRVRTRHGNSSMTRQVYVQDQDATSWTTSSNGGYVSFDRYKKIVGFDMFVENFGATWETSASTIAGQIIRKRDTLAFNPPNGRTLNLRDHGQHAYEGLKAGNTIYAVSFDEEGGTATIDKFKAAHETGHGLAHQRIGDHGASYSWTSTRALCTCDHIPGESHCLQSREKTRAAQYEGMAHFYSAAIWNPSRSQNAIWAYYKDVRWSISPNIIYDEPVELYLWTGQHYSGPTNPVKWLETNCGSGTAIQNSGVEWDWLVFFWRLWTGEDLNISKITSVWKRIVDEQPIGDPWYWNTVDTWAYEELSSSDYNDFYLTALDCGINH